MDVRVYYEDTDCGGVVYYANYLRYFERARTHYLEARHVCVSDELAQGTQFVVVHAELHYRSSARYGQALQVETVLAELTRVALGFTHVIREKASGRVVVEGGARLVATDLQGKPKRMSPALVRRLESRQE